MQRIIDAIIKNRKSFRLRAEGISMVPFLQSGDILYLAKVSFSKLKVNDLVMVKKGGRIFTHRVIYKKSNYIITKGDNNLSSDGKIYPRQIIGKVYQVKRNGKIFNPEDIYLIQSSLYFAEIVKIKKALEKEKIDFIFLKGLPLHLYFEDAHPRRIYADCDILIAEKDYFTAKKILENLHYKYHDDSYSETHKILKDKITEFSFYKNINNFPVLFDVHLEPVFMMNQLGKLNELYPQELIDKLTVDFLRDKQQLSINNQQFPILSLSNLILYLSLHFFHHNFRGAYRLELVDRVIKREALSVNRLRSRYREASIVKRNRPTKQASSPLDYFRLTDLISKYRLQNFVYPVFILLKKLYKTPIPDSFLLSIKPSDFQLNYQSTIINQELSIFNDEPRIKAGITRFKNLLYLSPNPWWRKMLIIFNPQVVYSIFWVLMKRLKRGFIML